MTPTNNNFCTLYIARHGETIWNASHTVQGHLDSPLTENGVNQAKQTAEELRHIDFAAVFSSDLDRAKKTAEIMKLERQMAVQTKKALRERTYGSWEGMAAEEYKKEFQLMLDKLKELSAEEQKKFKWAKDIESDEEITTRFITQLREISLVYPGKNVLVVSHGGPIRTFLIHAGYLKYEDLPPRSFANAGYVKVLCDGIDFFVEEVKGIKKE